MIPIEQTLFVRLPAPDDLDHELGAGSVREPENLRVGINATRMRT
jgi:hypothetical protein